MARAKKVTPKKPRKKAARRTRKPSTSTRSSAPGSPTPASAPTWSPAFLAALRGSANVRTSCAAAGVSRKVAYARRSTDPEFSAAWSEALDDGIDDLVAEARRRALTISDTLLIFLLKSHRPAVYRDRVEVSTPHALDVSQIPDHVQAAIADGLHFVLRPTS